jgi:hypothetical protein
MVLGIAFPLSQLLDFKCFLSKQVSFGTGAEGARCPSCMIGKLTGTVRSVMRHRRNIARVELPHPRTAELNRHDQNPDKLCASGNLDKRGAVHIDPSFPQWANVVENASIIRMTAGPRTTRKSAGKMKSTSGKISLIVVFAAASSTCCTRWVLRVSE